MDNKQLIQWLDVQMNEVLGSQESLRQNYINRKINGFMFDQDNAYWRGMYDALRNVKEKLQG